MINLLYYGDYQDHDTKFWLNIYPVNNIMKNNNSITINHYMDWIFIYGLLILSIWESLFSWYRYYTTRYISKRFNHASTSLVIKYFILYLIPFIIMFILNIHFYYWLFPMVIITHLLFNVYCNWKFCQILVYSYKQSTGYNQGIAKAIHNKMLKGVYRMRRNSLFCSILSTLSLCIILIIYNTQIIIYLPILWCIYSICFTLNFVRNRTSVYQYLFSIYQCCKYKQKRQQNINRIIERHSPRKKIENELADVMINDRNPFEIIDHDEGDKTLTIKDIKMRESNLEKDENENETDEGIEKLPSFRQYLSAPIKLQIRVTSPNENEEFDSLGTSNFSSKLSTPISSRSSLRESLRESLRSSQSLGSSHSNKRMSTKHDISIQLGTIEDENNDESIAAENGTTLSAPTTPKSPKSPNYAETKLNKKIYEPPQRKLHLSRSHSDPINTYSPAISLSSPKNDSKDDAEFVLLDIDFDDEDEDELNTVNTLDPKANLPLQFS